MEADRRVGWREVWWDLCMGLGGQWGDEWPVSGRKEECWPGLGLGRGMVC